MDVDIAAEPALDVPTTSPYSHLRQYVVSSTLTIDDPTVQVETGDPIELIRRLKAEGEKVARIARATGLSRPTIYRVLKQNAPRSET